MKNFKTYLFTTIVSAGLVGCSGPAADAPLSENKVEKSKVTQAEKNISLKLTEITWEDLMPEGEDELLETLYVEFYQNLETKMLQNSTTLAAAARQQGTDVSSIAEGSADDTMEQIGTFNVVKDLDGKHIRVPGYVVPFDFSADAEHKEFLLVPYFGACLHTPPPPPNQIILVKAETAAKITNIEDPVWLEGTLKTGEFLSDLGNSAYELNLSKLEPYEY